MFVILALIMSAPTGSIVPLSFLAALFVSKVWAEALLIIMIMVILLTGIPFVAAIIRPMNETSKML